MEAFLYNLMTIFATLVAVIVVIYKWRFSYWKRRGLATLPPTIPFGNTKLFDQDPVPEKFKKIYNQFKANGWKHGGFYTGTKVSYIPIDPEIIKCILQTDFSYFVNRGVFVNFKADPLNYHLFHLQDTEWRNLRAKLSPTFTSGKMKMMFHVVVACTESLKNSIKDYAENKKPVEIREILASFTMDVIGSCALGIECNALKNPASEFRKLGTRIFQFTKYDKYKRVFRDLMPKSFIVWLGLKMIKPEVEEFFIKTVKATVNYRTSNNVERKDFLQLLTELKIGEDQIAAQAYSFFLAGFETSSTTMAYALYELALNQDVQNTLRQEVRTVLSKYKDELTYDGIAEMRYLDKVIDETLRKYPPVPILHRICGQDYVVPGTTVKIEKGTMVIMPVYGIHCDPEYYPDPDRFDPERFSEKNKRSRPSFTWLPFGEGPRFCIGQRFGVMQSKIGLATLLKDYQVRPNERTEVPLQMNHSALTISPKGGVWLNVERVN